MRLLRILFTAILLLSIACQTLVRPGFCLSAPGGSEVEVLENIFTSAWNSKDSERVFILAYLESMYQGISEADAIPELLEKASLHQMLGLLDIRDACLKLALEKNLQTLNVTGITDMIVEYPHLSSSREIIDSVELLRKDYISAGFNIHKAGLLVNVGDLYAKMGRFDKADLIAQEVESFIEKHGLIDPYRGVKLLLSLAKLYVEIGSIKKSKIKLDQAAGLAQREYTATSSNNFASEYLKIAEIYSNAGQNYLARESFNVALAIANNVEGSTAAQITVLKKAALFYININDKAELNNVFTLLLSKLDLLNGELSAVEYSQIAREIVNVCCEAGNFEFAQKFAYKVKTTEHKVGALLKISQKMAAFGLKSESEAILNDTIKLSALLPLDRVEDVAYELAKVGRTKDLDVFLRKAPHWIYIKAKRILAKSFLESGKTIESAKILSELHKNAGKSMCEIPLELANIRLKENKVDEIPALLEESHSLFVNYKSSFIYFFQPIMELAVECKKSKNFKLANECLLYCARALANSLDEGKRHKRQTINGCYYFKMIVESASPREELAIWAGLYYKKAMPIFGVVVDGFLDSPDKLDMINSFYKAESDIKAGLFDKTNKMHLYANYAAVRSEASAYAVSNELSWDDYLAVINSSDKHDNFASMFELKLRGLAYEAFLLREEIMRTVNAEANSPRIVVENISNGAIAAAPITVKRKGLKFIVGSDIPVIPAKVSSSSCHNNEFFLDPDLFDDKMLEKIIVQRPNIYAVDSSKSVDDDETPINNIPDAYKGYRNYFIALNAGLAGTVNPADFNVDSGFIQILQDYENFKALVRKAARIAKNNNLTTFVPYKMLFWYPGNNTLYLRQGEGIPVKSYDKERSNKVLGAPKLFICQTSIEKGALSEQAKKFIGLNPTNIKSYHSCSFDDTKFFKEAHFIYSDKYGVRTANKFTDMSRKYFREYMYKYANPETAQPAHNLQSTEYMNSL